MFYKILKDNGFKFSQNPFSGSSYIMNDGLFLNLRENEEMFKDITGYSKAPIAVHGDLDMYIFKKGYSDEKINRVLGESDNAIRLSDGTNFIGYESPYISLPAEPVTYEQLESLNEWLLFLLLGNTQIDKIILRFNISKNANTDRIYDREDIYNLNSNIIDKIISDITRFYNILKITSDFNTAREAINF